MDTGSHASEFRRVVRVWLRRKIVLVGGVVIGCLILTALLAPWLTPYNPYKQDLRNHLRKPSAQHLLGTDALGRDVLSRIIYGCRTSLEVGVIAVGLAAVVGTLLGLAAGYLGGWVDAVAMRFIDALLAFPPLVLALSLAFVLGGGLLNCMVAVAVSLLPAFARMTRSQVLSIKETDYIMASRVIGGGSWRIVFRHVLPNSFPPLIILITLNMGVAILSEAALSFLGVGVKAPVAAWGSMLQQGYKYLFTHPHLSFVPGVCIMLVVLSFNLIGDGMRDALDPRLRGAV